MINLRFAYYKILKFKLKMLEKPKRNDYDDDDDSFDDDYEDYDDDY